MTCEYIAPTERTLTADGCIATNLIGSFDPSCCPPSLCDLNPCGIMCNFIQLLPNGPLWDRYKMEAMDYFRSTDCNGGYCRGDDSECSSLVDYAIYSGRRFYDLVMTALWPAIREGNPATSVTTIKSQLEALGWEDCWASSCRNTKLGALSPYECEGQCGPVYLKPTIPADLECAVNRGILLALKRLEMRPIQNLCGINWILEPLGAFIRPYRPQCQIGEFTVDTGLPEEDCCEGAIFEICMIDGRIEQCPDLYCTNSQKLERIDACYTQGYTAAQKRAAGCIDPSPTVTVICPGLLAAHCIALSYLPINACDLIIPIVPCVVPETPVGDPE